MISEQEAIYALRPALLRLAVELESDNDDGGDFYDCAYAALSWLERYGIAKLFWRNRVWRENEYFEAKTLKEAVALSDATEVKRIASGLHHALFTADEVEQLDGVAALDFVAGWIGGASRRLGGIDATHYLGHCDFFPRYREIFGKGFTLGSDWLAVQIKQAEKGVGA